MKTNDSAHYSPFELESRGWSITLIDNQYIEFSSETEHKCYDVFHAFYFPYGKPFINTDLITVLQFINDLIKEEQHKEEIERFNLDR